MSELLLVRALRYQWKIALPVFLCGLLLAYAIYSVNSRHRPPETHAAPPAPAVVAPSQTVGPAPVAPAVTAGEDVTNSRQMQRWRAGVRYLDARIEEAREALDGAGTPAAVATSEASIPAKDETAEPSSPPAPSPQEVALSRSVAEQKHRLEELRVVDTEAHPDVIEALEKLRRLESQLAALERARQTQASTHPAAPTAPKSVPTEPPGESAGFDRQQEAMANLSDLIHQRARLVQQMQNAAAAAGTGVSPEVPLLPLLEGTPPQQPAPDAPQQPASHTSDVSFAAISCALSAFIACLVAVWVEASQDHIPGPEALRNSLPDGVVFLGKVPRMRRQ